MTPSRLTRLCVAPLPLPLVSFEGFTQRRLALVPGVVQHCCFGLARAHASEESTWVHAALTLAVCREREEEAEKKAIEDQARMEHERKEAMLRGNPLLGGAAAAAGGAMGVKRRWDDDVVFRNQARNEPEVKKRFINDTTRNDFHRKFLGKYVK